MKNQKKDRVSFLSSIKTKIILLIVLAIVIGTIIVLWNAIPLMKENFSNLTQNYVYDLALSYGEKLELDVTDKGTEEALTTESIKRLVGKASMKDMESSYAYVVSADGTMLYHPTADKIGKPVENTVVSGVVEEIKQGRIPEPDVVSYDFNGSIKYAGYYVGENAEFILVISTDEDEIMEPLDFIVERSIKGGIFAIVICSVLGYLVAYRIVRPVLQIRNEVSRLTSLDFTQDRLQVKLNKRRDETGSMSRGITGLQQKLVEVITSIKVQSKKLYDAAEGLNDNTTEIKATSAQVDSAVSEIASGATSQAEETQSAKENVVHIGELVSQSNDEVHMLTESADEMQASGREAISILKKLDEISGQARESIDVIYEQTHTTNESALKIREVTELITSIAEETNLLSLNASIEAARAGEQGRGFAVVASQIQKLAEQSNASTKQIEEIIRSLISDSEKAVETMNCVKKIMEQQNDHVLQTNEIFTQVKEGIDHSIDRIGTIAGQMKELDHERNQVIDSVQNLTAIAEENAAGTEETSASMTEVNGIITDIAGSSQNLKQIAEELEQHMSIFKM